MSEFELLSLLKWFVSRNIVSHTFLSLLTLLTDASPTDAEDRHGLQLAVYDGYV